MKYAVFWDVTPCRSCKVRCLGGTYRLRDQDDKNQRARNNVSSISLRRLRRMLVIPNVAPSSPILVTQMMEVLHSSETSVLTRTTQRNMLEDSILLSRSRKYVKSYI
jgi:hypothetical protein